MHRARNQRSDVVDGHRSAGTDTAVHPKVRKPRGAQAHKSDPRLRQGPGRKVVLTNPLTPEASP